MVAVGAGAPVVVEDCCGGGCSGGMDGGVDGPGGPDASSGGSDGTGARDRSDGTEACRGVAIVEDTPAGAPAPCGVPRLEEIPVGGLAAPAVEARAAREDAQDATATRTRTIHGHSTLRKLRGLRERVSSELSWFQGRRAGSLGKAQRERVIAKTLLSRSRGGSSGDAAPSPTGHSNMIDPNRRARRRGATGRALDYHPSRCRRGGGYNRPEFDSGRRSLRRNALRRPTSAIVRAVSARIHVSRPGRGRAQRRRGESGRHQRTL